MVGGGPQSPILGPTSEQSRAARGRQAERPACHLSPVPGGLHSAHEVSRPQDVPGRRLGAGDGPPTAGLRWAGTPASTRWGPRSQRPRHRPASGRPRSPHGFWPSRWRGRQGSRGTRLGWCAHGLGVVGGTEPPAALAPRAPHTRTPLRLRLCQAFHPVAIGHARGLLSHLLHTTPHPPPLRSAQPGPRGRGAAR